MKSLTDRLHTLSGFTRSGLFAIITLLTGCNPNSQTALRVATIPWPGYETIHLAQSLGYLDSKSVRLVEMANNTQASMAFRNGTVDAGLLTLDETLNLLQDGVDLRVILIMDISDGADVVMARPEIASLQALRDKRVAVENTAVGALMLDALLEASGLDIADIKLVSKTVNEHTHAYIQGKVDAVVTFEPVKSELLKQGAHILFDSSQIPGRIIDVLTVRTSAMVTHQQALQALVAAHFRALDYLSSQPQDAAKRIAPFLSVTQEEVLIQFDGLKLPGLLDNRALLATTPPELKITAARLARLMLEHHLLQHQVDVSELADPRFLPQANK
jgi:NitT/TauT family transport system substrate-binding protein